MFSGRSRAAGAGLETMSCLRARYKSDQRELAPRPTGRTKEPPLNRWPVPAAGRLALRRSQQAVLRANPAGAIAVMAPSVGHPSSDVDIDAQQRHSAWH